MSADKDITGQIMRDTLEGAPYQAYATAGFSVTRTMTARLRCRSPTTPNLPLNRRSLP